MLRQAELFPTSVSTAAYDREEISFKKSVKGVPLEKVPEHSNVLGAYTVYKIKQEDHTPVKMNERIASHEKEDEIKNMMQKDCSMCNPTVVHVFVRYFRQTVRFGNFSAHFNKR